MAFNNVQLFCGLSCKIKSTTRAQMVFNFCVERASDGSSANFG